MKSMQKKTKKTKRIKIEKFFYGNSDVVNVNNKSLEFMYGGLNPKILRKEDQEHMMINGALAIDIVDAEKHHMEMKEKIDALKYHREMTELGYYREPMSWNEFRQWVLSNPEVMEEWYEQELGPEGRYEEPDDDICWQKVEE